MVKLWGREPALWLGLVAALVKLGTAFGLHLSVDQQSLINAFAAVAIGLVVAWLVHDGLPAAVLGFAQGALALAVGFGLHLAAEQQATIMSALGIAVAMFVRTQVIAPVPPEPVVVAARPAEVGTYGG